VLQRGNFISSLSSLSPKKTPIVIINQAANDLTKKDVPFYETKTNILEQGKANAQKMQTKFYIIEHKSPNTPEHLFAVKMFRRKQRAPSGSGLDIESLAC
jgi:hypothetical protein